MRKRFEYLFLGFSVFLFFNRCAQIVPLSGGQKDTTPPKLVEAEPAMNSTRFNSDEIILKFDEFVQLKDLSNQLMVCPRLKTNIELNADGKKILIHLKKEELTPNTTYRIFIGKAIADMTESNSVEKFEYVFSTGDFIDSLQLKGVIRDAFSNSPSGNIQVGLYTNPNSNDSLPFLEKPDYYTRTNESGEFQFKNLPNRSFKVYGIADLNKNGKYDGETEKIAFLSSPLQLIKDTSLDLKLFQEESTKVYLKKSNSPYYGFAQIIFNKASLLKVTTLNTSDQQNILETNIAVRKDTLAIYYRKIVDTLGLIIYHKNSDRSDTLKLPIPKIRSNKKALRNFHLNTPSDKLPLQTKLKINFANWMDTANINVSKIKLRSKVDSSILEEAVIGAWASVSCFEISNKLKEGMNYTLKLDSNAFFDINSLTNDSMAFKFTVHSKSDFGKVRLKLKLNKKQSYIVQLMNDQNQVSNQQFFHFALSSSNVETIDFTDVLPGNYTTKIIYDDNNNQKWDSGDLILQKMPEEVIINSKQLKVLSEWEIEEEITIRE